MLYVSTACPLGGNGANRSIRVAQALLSGRRSEDNMPSLREVAALAQELEKQRFVNLDVPVRTLLQGDVTGVLRGGEAELSGHVLAWSGWAFITPNIVAQEGISSAR